MVSGMVGTPLRVVVLSDYSLFADGIFARLKKLPELFEVHIVDGRLADPAAQLLAAKPTIVVVAAIDSQVAETRSIIKVLEALPAAIVFRLDCNSDRVQIFSAEQRRAHEMNELMAMMQNTAMPYREMSNA